MLVYFMTLSSLNQSNEQLAALSYIILARLFRELKAILGQYTHNIPSCLGRLQVVFDTVCLSRTNLVIHFVLQSCIVNQTSFQGSVLGPPPLTSADASAMAAVAAEWLESSAEDEKGCRHHRRRVGVELEELAEAARVGQPKHVSRDAMRAFMGAQCGLPVRVAFGQPRPLLDNLPPINPFLNTSLRFFYVHSVA